MIRVCRNLAALGFLVAFASMPASAVAMQGERAANCTNVSYGNNGDSVEFSGCLDDCGWLSDHCVDYCDGGDYWFTCDGDGEAVTWGTCDCFYIAGRP